MSNPRPIKLGLRKTDWPWAIFYHGNTRYSKNYILLNTIFISGGGQIEYLAMNGYLRYLVKGVKGIFVDLLRE